MHVYAHVLILSYIISILIDRQHPHAGSVGARGTGSVGDSVGEGPHTHRHLHTHTHTHTHTCMYVCMHPCMHIHIHTYTHTHTRPYGGTPRAGTLRIYACIHTHAHTCTYKANHEEALSVIEHAVGCKAVEGLEPVVREYILQ